MPLTKYEEKLLKEFSLAYSASGYEKNVSHLFKEHISQYCDEIIYDNLGSIYGIKKSKAAHPLKVMVCAHSDEVALKVTEICANGLIKFSATSIWNQILMGQRVTLINSKNELFKGAICATPIHLLTAEQKKSPIEVKNMFADFGFLDKEDALQHFVSINNAIFVDGTFEILNKNRILAKALDDRIGCALLVEVIKSLKNVALPYDLYLGLNVQEEVGLRGATTASQMIQPDFAIVVDCSPANDLMGKQEMGQLGKGILLRVVDGNMIAFPQLIDYQKKLCNQYHIPYQYFISNGGTDAGAIHQSNQGVLTLTSCICARNIHSNSSIMDVNDYLANLKFLKVLLKTFTPQKFDTLVKAGR